MLLPWSLGSSLFWPWGNNKTQTILRFPASCDCNSEPPQKKHSPSFSLCICINLLLLMLRTLLPFCRLAAKEIHIGGPRSRRLVSTPQSSLSSHTHTYSSPDDFYPDPTSLPSWVSTQPSWVFGVETHLGFLFLFFFF
jgi:hypothetical protein